MFYTFLQVLGGTGFTFFMTILGAAVVFFFRGAIGDRMNRAFLGFASGVMMAASVWSLLIPSIEQSREQGMLPWLPPAAGFAAGGVFLYLVDKILPWFHADYRGRKAGTKMLVLAVTVHNIPEGMAVGLGFVLAGQHIGEPGYLAAAIGLAVGIGIQNFPEGAAISLPVFYRLYIRNCGTCGRNISIFYCFCGSASDALASGVCGRSDDLCGCR